MRKSIEATTTTATQPVMATTQSNGIFSTAISSNGIFSSAVASNGIFSAAGVADIVDVIKVTKITRESENDDEVEIEAVDESIVVEAKDNNNVVGETSAIEKDLEVESPMKKSVQISNNQQDFKVT